MPAIDPLVEAARELARAEISRSSLRQVAGEIGIAHQTLSELVAEGSQRQPYGSGRAKLLEWAEARGIVDPTADQVSYFRGKQDALMGMMRYVIDQQAEIGRFLGALRQTGALPRTPEDLSRAFDEGEAEAELLARVQRQRPEPKPKPQGKKRRA